MTNAQRAELKMWIRRLESAKKAINTFTQVRDVQTVFVEAACNNIDLAVTHLEAVTSNGH